MFAYTWTGLGFSLYLRVLNWDKFRTSWFNPRTGETTPGDLLKNDKTYVFDPPGEETPGNDWVLVVEKS